MEQQNPHTGEGFGSYEYVNKQCCCFNMRRVMRAVTQYYDHHLEAAGIRSTQFTLLVALASTKAKTLTEIAESLVMDRTTLTRNLKPLSKLGLIQVVQTVDKRSKAYTLTDHGKEVVMRGVPRWQEAQSSIVNNLGEERYSDLVNKLEALLRLLSMQR